MGHITQLAECLLDFPNLWQAAAFCRKLQLMPPALALTLAQQSCASTRVNAWWHPAADAQQGGPHRTQSGMLAGLLKSVASSSIPQKIAARAAEC